MVLLPEDYIKVDRVDCPSCGRQTVFIFNSPEDKSFRCVECMHLSLPHYCAFHAAVGAAERRYIPEMKYAIPYDMRPGKTLPFQSAGEVIRDGVKTWEELERT